jgi:hypothetical protein
MNLSTVYDIYRRMEDEQIILSFKGTFTSDLLTSIISIMEVKMIRLEISPQKKRRVINVMIECFQNLYHHIENAEVKEENIGNQKSALIIVRYVEGKFIVRTGNYVQKSHIESLKNRIDSINELNVDELRDLYRKKLLHESRTSKGTGGLGFIDIARKSEQKLEYEFINISERTSFFCLNVVIE